MVLVECPSEVTGMITIRICYIIILNHTERVSTEVVLSRYILTLSILNEDLSSNFSCRLDRFRITIFVNNESVLSFEVILTNTLFTYSVKNLFLNFCPCSLNLTTQAVPEELLILDKFELLNSVVLSLLHDTELHITNIDGFTILIDQFNANQRLTAE